MPIKIDGTFVNPKEPIATLENCQSVILIQKVDQNNTALQGAEFGLYDESGKLIMTAVSDMEGMARFIGADYGKYTIRELSAPDGYLVSRDVISVTIDEGYTNTDKPAATVIDPEKEDHVHQGGHLRQAHPRRRVLSLQRSHHGKGGNRGQRQGRRGHLP